MKPPRFLLSAFALLALSMSPGDATAGVIAAWDTLGLAGNEPFAPPTSAAHYITPTNITRSAGLIGTTTGANSLNSSGWESAPAGSPAADTEYLEFGFNVAPGFQVDLTSLKIATRSSNTGPGTLGLYTSLDGFTNPVYIFVQPGDNFLNSDIDLSSLPLISGSFTVRIIEIGNIQADGSGTTASTGTFRVGDYFDGTNFLDIQFETNTVPEPSTLVLMLLFVGLAMLIGLTRLRARRTRLAGV